SCGFLLSRVRCTPVLAHANQALACPIRDRPSGNRAPALPQLGHRTIAPALPQLGHPCPRRALAVAGLRGWIVTTSQPSVRRASCGGIPVQRLKARRNSRGSLKPTALPTSATLSAPACSSCSA